MNWTPSLPASLYRLSETEIADEIGAGTLVKMVRIALSDPDAELWRYSINSGGEIIRGREIASLSRALRNLDLN